MQIFLVICAICLQLNNLANNDPQGLQLRDTACEQCLTSLNGSSGSPLLQNLTTSETPSIEQHEEPRPGYEEGFPVKSPEPTIEQLEAFKFKEQIPLFSADYTRELKKQIIAGLESLGNLVKDNMPKNSYEIVQLLENDKERLNEMYLYMFSKILEEIAVSQESLPQVMDTSFKISRLIARTAGKLSMLVDTRIKTLEKHIKLAIANKENTMERLQALSQLRTLILRGELPQFPSTLRVHQTITRSNRGLTSENGFYTAEIQSSGKLEIKYLQEKIISSLNVNMTDEWIVNAKLVMKRSGNLVMENSSGEIVWETKTSDADYGSRYYVKLENDGSLVMYNHKDQVIKKIISVGDSIEDLTEVFDT